jgi:pSer/pThr/pTyr-binding forkhead associated (FHA) protein
MGIVITVMSGADDGKVLEFDKTPIVLGRHPEDDVCLPYDTRVSRHHARITKEGEAYFIEEIGPGGRGSTNGTFVNEKRVTSRTPLSTGDMILFGSVWVKFEVRHKGQDV